MLLLIEIKFVRLNRFVLKHNVCRTHKQIIAIKACRKYANGREFIYIEVNNDNNSFEKLSFYRHTISSVCTACRRQLYRSLSATPSCHISHHRRRVGSKKEPSHTREREVERDKHTSSERTKRNSKKQEMII